LEMGGEFCFRLGVVELGVNRRGKPVTSCVVEALDEAPETAKKNRRPRGQQQRIVLKALKNALARFGETRGSYVSVTEEQWKSEALTLLVGERKHRHTTFLRAADALLGDDFVGKNDDVCWII